MSAIKYLLEVEKKICGSVAKATGIPSFGGFTDEEMEMGRYDHARSDEMEAEMDAETDMEDGE
jgi:hypothetical protein